MNRSRIAIALATCAAVLTGLAGPASASDLEIVREYREVPGAGVFTTCADGSEVSFNSLSYRDYTTWLRDGVAVRERRHLTYDGTLTRAGNTLGYTGVWNRDQDFEPARSGSPVASSGSICLPVAPWWVRDAGRRQRVQGQRRPVPD